MHQIVKVHRVQCHWDDNSDRVQQKALELYVKVAKEGGWPDKDKKRKLTEIDWCKGLWSEKH